MHIHIYKDEKQTYVWAIDAESYPLVENNDHQIPKDATDKQKLKEIKKDLIDAKCVLGSNVVIVITARYECVFEERKM